MPKIRQMLLNLEGFQYAAALDLNIGYYRIRLSEESSNLCTIILPWGKYKYKLLPMGGRGVTLWRFYKRKLFKCPVEYNLLEHTSMTY